MCIQNIFGIAVNWIDTVYTLLEFEMIISVNIKIHRCYKMGKANKYISAPYQNGPG